MWIINTCTATVPTMQSKTPANFRNVNFSFKSQRDRRNVKRLDVELITVDDDTLV